MNSRLYVGQVRHRRFTPREHCFSYSMFMMYLDLDELPRLFDRFWLWSARGDNIASFRREDHLGDSEVSLKRSVLDLVHRHSGIQVDGAVYLLTHLRYFGYGFNPASFYYCHDRQQRLKAIVVEVNNTPWGEQYHYVLPVNDNGRGRHHFELKKAFHVSPFNDMEQQYRWHFRTPDRLLSVHMENWQDAHKVFDATLLLEARALNSSSLAMALIRFPMMTFKIIGAIYWEALKLWLKKTPVHDHPAKGIRSSHLYRGQDS